MARPLRIEFAGAIYHVMARGNARQKIFEDDRDRERLRDGLARTVERCGWELLVFAFMPNHLHLFLRTPEPNLSAAMHWINASYTQRFHRRHRTGGHLLQGRYKSVLVAEQAHWLHVSAYIHLNPVRARLADDPVQYEWSSFRDYTRSRRRFEWLKPEYVLARFGATGPERRRRYRAHVLALSDLPASFWEEIRSAVFLGAEDQWEAIRKKHPPRGDRRTAPQLRRKISGNGTFRLAEPQIHSAASSCQTMPVTSSTSEKSTDSSRRIRITSCPWS